MFTLAYVDGALTVYMEPSDKSLPSLAVQPDFLYMLPKALTAHSGPPRIVTASFPLDFSKEYIESVFGKSGYIVKSNGKRTLITLNEGTNFYVKPRSVSRLIDKSNHCASMTRAMFFMHIPIYKFGLIIGQRLSLLTLSDDVRERAHGFLPHRDFSSIYDEAMAHIALQGQSPLIYPVFDATGRHAPLTLFDDDYLVSISGSTSILHKQDAIERRDAKIVDWAQRLKELYDSGNVPLGDVSPPASVHGRASFFGVEHVVGTVEVDNGFPFGIAPPLPKDELLGYQFAADGYVWTVCDFHEPKDHLEGWVFLVRTDDVDGFPMFSTLSQPGFERLAFGKSLVDYVRWSPGLNYASPQMDLNFRSTGRRARTLLKYYETIHDISSGPLRCFEYHLAAVSVAKYDTMNGVFQQVKLLTFSQYERLKQNHQRAQEEKRLKRTAQSLVSKAQDRKAERLKNVAQMLLSQRENSKPKPLSPKAKKLLKGMKNG